ncbi:hypothetical protein DL96DRAFT_807422 [Flagelloscypha sp. PMI_526]|nr:hypothetical protein DL96DRAFT_807422 [Flagelloscypha sp. PMI_526]
MACPFFSQASLLRHLDRIHPYCSSECRCYRVNPYVANQLKGVLDIEEIAYWKDRYTLESFQTWAGEQMVRLGQVHNSTPSANNASGSVVSVERPVVPQLFPLNAHKFLQVPTIVRLIPIPTMRSQVTKEPPFLTAPAVNSRPLKRKSRDNSLIDRLTEEARKIARIAHDTVSREENEKVGPTATPVIDLTFNSDSETHRKPNISQESQVNCDTQVRKFLHSLADFDLDQYPELRQTEVVKKLLFCRGIQAVPLETVVAKSIMNLKELDKFVIVTALQQFSSVN